MFESSSSPVNKPVECTFQPNQIGHAFPSECIGRAKPIPLFSRYNENILVWDTMENMASDQRILFKMWNGDECSQVFCMLLPVTVPAAFMLSCNSFLLFLSPSLLACFMNMLRVLCCVSECALFTPLLWHVSPVLRCTCPGTWGSCEPQTPGGSTVHACTCNTLKRCLHARRPREPLVLLIVLYCEAIIPVNVYSGFWTLPVSCLSIFT